MNEGIISLLISENIEKIRIGDYFYEDGTFSHEYQEEKKCIGIVFSPGNTFDYPNWNIVALTDAKNQNGNNIHLWRSINNNFDALLIAEKNKKIEYNNERFRFDYGGFSYSQNNFGSEYEAIKCAREYPVNIPLHKTSGWYLPSSGQMWQIAHRFIHNDEFVEQKSMLNLADKYMVSQPQETICPLCLDLLEREFSFGNTDERFIVRPVFSF